jgi:hypothetical protein
MVAHAAAAVVLASGLVAVIVAVNRNWLRR